MPLTTKQRQDKFIALRKSENKKKSVYWLTSKQKIVIDKAVKELK